jgi:hypothetical protein
MEHRQPPGIAALERRLDPAEPDSRVNLRVHPPGSARPVRPVASGRVTLVLLAAVLLVVVSIYLGARVFRSAVDWLTDQAPYQVPFEKIQLIAAPPEWYRGGSSAFLKSVRRLAEPPATLPVLKLDPRTVKMAFLRNPWVEQVVRVSFPPHGLSVELHYRKPVALVRTPASEEYLLDAKATILPLEDVDLDRLTRLRRIITISGSNLVAPEDPHPGATWKPKGGIADVSPGNDRIAAAAKLASFLLEKTRSLDSARFPALEIRRIFPTDPQNRGLFVWNGEETWILWGEAPGEEGRERPTAEDKWTALRHWSCSQGPESRRIPPREYWEFSKDGLRHVVTDPTPSLRDASTHDESPGPEKSSG